MRARVGWRLSGLSEAATAGARPPGREAIERLAGRVIESLPDRVARRFAGAAIIVKEFADGPRLSETGVRNPFDLLGFIEPMDAAPSTRAAPVITLYRRPLLDFWAERAAPFEHVLLEVLEAEIARRGLKRDPF